MFGQFDLTEKNWNSKSDVEKTRYMVIRPMRKSAANLCVSFADLEQFLASQEAAVKSLGGCFELIPDFQRGHVWTQSQQIKYIESLMRDMAPNTLLFNCPGWVNSYAGGDISEQHMMCIDGLQRLTAVRAFIAGAFKVFDRWHYQDMLTGSLRASSLVMNFKIYEISSREQLLQMYLDINSGGTAHAQEELIRVQGLLEAASLRGT